MDGMHIGMQAKSPVNNSLIQMIWSERVSS